LARNDAIEICYNPGNGIPSQEDAMNLTELNKVAEAMVAPGRGILAADESSGTIK